eukprot:3239806-Amphidinium_carterae.1
MAKFTGHHASWISAPQCEHVMRACYRECHFISAQRSSCARENRGASLLPAILCELGASRATLSTRRGIIEARRLTRMYRYRRKPALSKSNEATMLTRMRRP